MAIRLLLIVIFISFVVRSSFASDIAEDIYEGGKQTNFWEQGWSFSIYGGRWSQTNLPSIPGNLLRGQLKLRDTGYVGIGLSKDLITDFSIPLPGEYSLTGFDLELESQLLKHFGHQKHIESTIALVLRTGDVFLTDNFFMNFAIGEGFSYAYKDPTYEKGPDGIVGEDTRRLQNHLLFEMAMSLTDLPGKYFVTRIHHRSGVYGLISPRKTGSNYFTFGLRFDF